MRNLRTLLIRTVQSFINLGKPRIVSDGGTIEAENCTHTTLFPMRSSIEKASLILTSLAYKASKLYAVKPYNGNGDLTWTRATPATRINSSGLIESVASNIPRLNYPIGGGCPSILLEPARTNLVFPSATATTQTRTVTAVAHTISFYGTGSVTLSGVATGTLNGTGASNKVKLVFTPTAGSLILTVTGSVTNWQVEAGSYGTSLIPTTTAAVTRNADTFTRNNIYTNGLISASGGSWYVELENNLSLTRDATATGLFIGDTTSPNNGFKLRTGGLGRLVVFKTIAAADSVLYTTTTDTLKMVINWNGSTCNVFVNGVKVVTGSVFTATALEHLIGGAADVPKYIKKMALYSTPITDAEAILLTT